MFKLKDQDCKFNPDTVGTTCAGYTDIAKGDEDSLTTALAIIGPVSIAIDAS